MTIEKMSKDNGTTNYNGKIYVLVQQAYIDGPVDAPYYCATAICPADGVDEYGLYPIYRITWNPRQDWLDGDRDDEGWACDWDSADDVELTGSGYDLNDGRSI